MKQKDDNPTVGLILCEDKKDAVVRYTLPKNNKQIFASKYKLYLPTEDELVKELKRERFLVESQINKKPTKTKTSKKKRSNDKNKKQKIIGNKRLAG